MVRYGCDEALRAHVLGIFGVGELVGQRLFADVAPQKPTLPYGVLNLIGDAERFRKMAGSPNKTIRARYQIDWYAATRAQARFLATLASARAADGGLDGFRGAMGIGQTAAFVQSVRIENRLDDWWEPESAGESRVYVSGFDAIVVFNE